MLQAGAVANDSSSPALFVATTPCRLLDTRDSPETVGPRATPLGARRHVHRARDRHHRLCPADRRDDVGHERHRHRPDRIVVLDGVGDGTRPLACSLNWDITSGDTANAVTANVSANGELSFYNLAGTTNIVADVVGYYTSTAFEDYFTKAEVAAMIADNPGAVGPVGSTGASRTRTERPDHGTDRCYRPDRANVDGRPDRSGRQASPGPPEPTAERSHGPTGPQGEAGLDRTSMAPPCPAQPDRRAAGPTGPSTAPPARGTAGSNRPTGAIGSGVAALFYAMMPATTRPSPSVARSISRRPGPNTDDRQHLPLRNDDR